MDDLHDLAYVARCVGTADSVVKGKYSKPTESDWQIGLGDDEIDRDGWPRWIRQTRNTLRLFRAATKAAKNALDNANEIRPNEQAADQWKPRCYRLLMLLANALHDTGSIEGDVASFVDRGSLPSEWPTWLAELDELADEYQSVELSGVNAPEPAATEPATNATNVTDPALLAQFANLLDDTALKVLTIIQDGERSVDDKLRLLSALDVRHYGKTSKQLADLLGVTEQAIRKTKWWKVDRHQNV